jgi:hypothetical protein
MKAGKNLAIEQRQGRRLIMATDEQIKELAYSIWEQEGRPEGKDVEHYYQAREILEKQEAARIIEIAPPTPLKELSAPPPVKELPAKERRKTRKRK